MQDKRLEALAVPEAARPGVQRWRDLLREWNQRMDLTAARGDDELFDLMLADALALAPRVAVNRRVVDVGCGAGAPGLALALLRPDLAVRTLKVDASAWPHRPAGGDCSARAVPRVRASVVDHGRNLFN
jgi:16S rRNA G527 N7-methylase RsmG